MKGSDKNSWALFLLILSGICLGGFVGTLTEAAPELSWLGYGQTFGLDAPVIINLGIFVIQFGISINLTIASIIGVILAVVIYHFM